MSDNDFMLHVICTLPKEYKSVLTDLENRLMAESSEKRAIELHQLNALFKRLHSKKEEVEEEKTLAAIKKQVEEKVLAV